MGISFVKNTRKHLKKHKENYIKLQNTNAKKGTQLRCRLKTCRTKMYQSVYGAARGGKIRSNRALFY